jgi:fumarate reductase flavoprotein subunit
MHDEKRINTPSEQEDSTKQAALSRRSFLKIVGITGAATATAAGLAACVPNGGSSPNDTPSGIDATKAPINYDISATEEVDLVVIGAGAAGCSAAVRAAQLGLKTALLEITAVVGGTTIFTEGMTSLHSKYHTPEIDWETAEMVHRIQDYHHWLSDGGIIRQMLEQSATNIDWLESIGHKFSGLGTMTGASKLTWTMYAHAPNEPSGTDYCKHWSELVTDTYKDQITVHFMTRGLATTVENGQVSAVIAEDLDSKKYTQFNCKAVVYATGGYADNPTLFKEFVGFGEGEYLPMGMGQRTGDGISQGREAGGKLCRYPSCTMWYGGCLEGIQYGTEFYCGIAFQPLFWVNEKAVRYVDETYAERNFSFAGNADSAQERIISILTQKQIDSMVSGTGSVYGCGDYIKGGTKLDGTATGKSFWDEYDEQLKAGNKYMFKADTLAALAEAVGLDATVLADTVKRYNASVPSGKDSDFGKDFTVLPTTFSWTEFPFALEDGDGPFYAFELKPAVFTTAGGLAVNNAIQVLGTADNKPIVGMYAAGCDSGGLEGDSYDVGICEGSKQCWCAYSGKLAAEHMADTIFGKPSTDEYTNPVTWK